MAKSLSKFPIGIVDWATEEALFVSSTLDAYAFFLPRERWNTERGLIFLCDGLKDQPEDIQAFYIGEELAHLKLGHTSPIFSNLSLEETDKQEEDAKRLARERLDL